MSQRRSQAQIRIVIVATATAHTTRATIMTGTGTRVGTIIGGMLHRAITIAGITPLHAGVITADMITAITIRGTFGSASTTPTTSTTIAAGMPMGRGSVTFGKAIITGRTTERGYVPRYHIGAHYVVHPRTVYINDYYHYGLYAPPPGHYWVRDHHSGDAILASIATGAIIGLVIGAIAYD